MKLLGKGAFTKAYLLDDNKTVYLDSCDPIKEIQALGWFPESPLFPTIKRAEDGHGYIMAFYPKVRAPKQELTAKSYELYLTLRRIYLDTVRPLNKFDSYATYFKAFSNDALLDEETKETLLEALDGCANAGSDIAFEISPRNISYNADRELVLMDCFYSISQLKKVKGR